MPHALHNKLKALHIVKFGPNWIEWKDSIGPLVNKVLVLVLHSSS